MSQQNLAQLRKCLQELGLNGLIVTKADYHQNEYVPAYLDRLQWLSGFSGSAGTAVITQNHAVLFVDGRYTVQAEQQSGSEFEIFTYPAVNLASWVKEHLTQGEVWGLDGATMIARQGDQLAQLFHHKECTLKSLPSNPIDALWNDRPKPELGPILDHDLKFAGKKSEEKIKTCASDLNARGLDAALISTCEGVAWLLNLRGSDVPFTPVALAFAVLHATGDVHLFIDEERLEPQLKQRLQDQVTLHPYSRLMGYFARLKNQKVLLDQSTGPYSAADALRCQGCEIVYDYCITLIHRAWKNPIEQEGIRQAHIRDGAALCQGLAWLKTQDITLSPITEMDVAERLYQERSKQEHFRGLSFGTIVGSGPHGAVIHYQATPSTNRRLQPNDVIVIDSGAQYWDATTDVTRTVVLGKPSTEAMAAFTRTLKGHIRLARAVFPRGTTGSQLDALARYDLWQDQKDYAHGTGHGIGAHLHVHEGPHTISSRPNNVALVPGMLVSNEPGYYARDAFGIRIESVIMVNALNEDASWLGFETLTLAPIDRDLVDVTMLTPEERDWLDDYHARVYKTIAPLVNEATNTWLQEVTKPLP